MSEQDQDPRPLKASGETPAELVRALNALGRDRDAARLARVAQSLGPQLGPAGGAGAAGAADASGLSGLTGTKLALIGLALGLGAWGLLSSMLATPPPASSVHQNAAPASSPAPATAPAPTTVLEQRPVEQVPTERAVAPAPLSTRTQPPSAARSATRSREARARATETAAQTTTPSAKSAPEAVATPVLERPLAQPEPQPPAEPAREATQPPAKPSAAAAPPPSEVALLQRARKLAASEPEAALRLLDQHAARFASGMLVPERELLAIEVLRDLGREAEAERRLQRFEARYPESIHRRRLERSSATDDER